MGYTLRMSDTRGQYSPLMTNVLSPMALKKSELYSSLWASCDELWSSMDTGIAALEANPIKPARSGRS